MASSDRQPRNLSRGRSEGRKPEQTAEIKSATEKPAKLWVSPKLRDSLRPSTIRTSEVDPDLFGQLTGRDRMRTHPYVVLADKVLGKGPQEAEAQAMNTEQEPAEGDSVEVTPIRRRA